MARFEIILSRRRAVDEEPMVVRKYEPERLTSILLALLVTAVAIGVLLAAALIGSVIFVLFLVLLVVVFAIRATKTVLQRSGRRPTQ
jgi:hypothetical protein